MERLRNLVQAFIASIEVWGRSRNREQIVDLWGTGPCPSCGEERIRLRDVRVDDLGYSVRTRERWSCGCDDEAEGRPGRSDPAGVV